MDDYDLDDILSGMGYDDDDLAELEGEVGDYELSGYGEEIVGARRGRGRRMAPPGRRARIRRVANTSLRRYPLGLGITSVPAAGTVIIRANPQLPFKLERVSTPTLAMTIDNVQVGTVSQFVAAGGVPTETFGPNAVGIQLKGDTAVPGVDVAVTVTNPGVLANFTGAIIGLVAQ